MKIKLQRGLFEGNGTLTQEFGKNPQAYAKFGLKGHNGIDYGIPNGTKLFSCINGVVTEQLNDKTGYGIYIKIENDHCGVIYGHLKSTALKVNDKVTAGDVIGLSNNTGNSTGPHLHFGLFPKPRDRGNGYAGYIDPLNKNLVEWVDNINDTTSTELELQQKYDLLKRDCDDYKEQIAKQMSEKDDHIESIQKSLSETNSQLQSQLNLIARLETQYDEKSKEYEILLAEKNALESTTERLETENRTLSEKIIKLKKEVADAMANQVKKDFYKSKTLWVNLIAIVAVIFGLDIPTETQVGILALINILLRSITKEEIVWKNPLNPEN